MDMVFVQLFVICSNMYTLHRRFYYSLVIQSVSHVCLEVLSGQIEIETSDFLPHRSAQVSKYHISLMLILHVSMAI